MVATLLFKSSDSKVCHLSVVFCKSLQSVAQNFTDSAMNFCQIVVINDIFATVLLHKLLFMLQYALHYEQQQNKIMLLVTLQALQLKRLWNK